MALNKSPITTQVDFMISTGHAKTQISSHIDEDKYQARRILALIVKVLHDWSLWKIYFILDQVIFSRNEVTWRKGKVFIFADVPLPNLCNDSDTKTSYYYLEADMLN